MTRKPHQSQKSEVTQEEQDEYDDRPYREMRELETQYRRVRVDLPRNLRALRKSLRLRQPEMAKAVGVSTRSWQLYETGERAVPSNVLSELYARFDVDLHAVFLGQPRGLAREERKVFSDFVSGVIDHIEANFPDLRSEERAALRREYVKFADIEEEIDGGLMLQCYNALFEPEWDDNGAESK